MNPEYCPECDGYDTDRVETFWDMIEVTEVRICDDCTTEYTVTYTDPFIQTTHTEQ